MANNNNNNKFRIFHNTNNKSNIESTRMVINSGSKLKFIVKYFLSIKYRV